MSANDSIVAAATPTGESAIGVVRVSGPLCGLLTKNALGVPSPTPRKACLTKYRDINDVVVDEVIFLFFEAGKSYTGEASLEISSHGNPLIIKKIIEDLIVRGCRLAEPGEFTRRAFLSERLDLTQAESVANLIRARCDGALEAARLQLRGSLGRKVRTLQSCLLDLQANLEAYIDFPEEDLPPETSNGPISTLSELIQEVVHLRGTVDYGRLLDVGARCLIVGAPNAGKSSLFNALCGEDRAIVSEEDGTTRDYLSSHIELGPFSVELIDTAGLREGATNIEYLGIEKTLELAEEADYFLYVLDTALPSQETIYEALVTRLSVEKCLVLENKIDLPASKALPEFLPACIHLRLSLQTGEGLAECRIVLERMLKELAPPSTGDGVVVNARHAERLEAVEVALRETHRILLDQGSLELALSDIRMAIKALGEIVGKTDNEDMLDRLFQSFCIGK